MICYICKLSVKDYQPLVINFKIIHMLKPNSTYECCEDSCFQSFQSLASFKRHVERKHETCNSQDYAQPSETLNINMVAQSTSNSIASGSFIEIMNDDELGTTLQSAETPFNFDDVVNDLYKSTAKFILSLYSNNNFNNSDIAIIQSGVKNNILNPIISIFEQLIEKKTKEPLLLNIMLRFKSLILDPFKYCATDYGLNNWLKNNNYKSNIRQFTTNNELSTLQHDGLVIYNEKVKGALLDLKFQFKKFFEHGDNFETNYNRLIHLKSNNENISNFVQGDLWRKKNFNVWRKNSISFFFIHWWCRDK